MAASWTRICLVHSENRGVIGFRVFQRCFRGVSEVCVRDVEIVQGCTFDWIQEYALSSVSATGSSEVLIDTGQGCALS